MRNALPGLEVGRRAGPLALAMVLAGLVAAPTAAQILPPPPYAADQSQLGQSPAGQYKDPQDPRRAAASPQGLDRYGGGYRRTAVSASQPDPKAAPQPAPSGPRLAWAGKVEMQAPVAAPAQSGGWSSVPQRWTAPPRPQASVQPSPQVQPQARADSPSEMAARMAPPSNPWRPYHPQVSAGDGQASTATAPISIYDPPPAGPAPAPQPYRQAQAAPNPEGGPRFYSLHKDYGIQPDPIPLPPQFFGPTADLSAPAAAPLSRRTITVNGQTRTVNAPDDQGAQ